MDQETIIKRACSAECFVSEAAYLARGRFIISTRPRLFKFLEHESARLIFPVAGGEFDEGAAVGLVCLYDMNRDINLYAHAVFAGPNVNASLRSLFVPATQAKPQAGIDRNKAILKFVAWKQAAWMKFLNDDLELGTEAAATTWRANFWKALDRMYGGGNLNGDK